MEFGIENGYAEEEPAASIAAELFDRYGDGILRFAFSYMHNLYDAEDVLQETLIRYLENKPKFADMRQEKCWMFKVAANVAKDMLRRRKVRETEELHENIAADSNEELDYIWEAVAMLPMPCRETIHLYYQEGYSTEEIAMILDMKTSTVRSYLKRGRERLKKLLRKDYLG